MARRWLDRLPGKRVFLARTLEATGSVRVLERSAFRRQGPVRALLVFTYHRIAVPGIPANPYYDPVISATPDGFRDQVRMLARRYRLIGLGDLLEDNRSRSDDRPAALITFDDGYRDNYTNALPILQELGAKAVFFIPSGLIDAAPWPEPSRTSRSKFKLVSISSWMVSPPGEVDNAVVGVAQRRHCAPAGDAETVATASTAASSARRLKPGIVPT